MNAHACPEGALGIAGVGDLPQQRNHAQFLQQNRIEGDLVEAIENVPGGSWRARALDGVDLHENCIVRLTFPHQRRDRGVAGIAAVPIVVALDFDGLEHGRQTGGGEQDIGVISRLRNTRPWPVRTFVAVTNSLIGARPSRSKSMHSARICRSGLEPPGFRS